MSTRINNNHKDVKTSIATDPNEFFAKLSTQFGGLPIKLGVADVTNLTTIKNAATTAAPFTTIINLINAGEIVTVEPSTVQ